MHVLFSISGESKSLWIDDCPDLAHAFRTIRQRLLADHAELKDRSELVVRLADELLNALADERDQIILGELISAK